MSLHQPESLYLLAPEKCLLPLRYVISGHHVLPCIYLYTLFYLIAWFCCELDWTLLFMLSVSGPPMRWETPLCVCGNVLHTFPVGCQLCWSDNIGPALVTIFRLCSTCPSLFWRFHVMVAGCNITWWPATWFLGWDRWLV